MTTVKIQTHGRERVSGVPACIAAFTLTAVCMLPGQALAQLSTPPIPTADHLNGLGFGLSYGEQNDRAADFFGWSIDYSRSLGNRWTLGTSLAWDEETERFRDKPDKSTKTYNILGTISYNLTPRLAITTGFGKGIATDGNDDQDMRFSDGDLSTGVAFGYGIPLNDRYTMGASIAYEYNISENETSYSMDLTIGWSF